MVHMMIHSCMNQAQLLRNFASSVLDPKISKQRLVVPIPPNRKALRAQLRMPRSTTFVAPARSPQVVVEMWLAPVPLAAKA